MKKFSLVVVLLVATITLQAQFLSVGAKAGYNVTIGNNTTFSDIYDVKGNLGNGFNLGLYARIGKRWYVQPELLYSFSYQKETLSAVGVDITSYNKINKTSTFDVPVLLGYSLLNWSSLKLNLMVGPKFSFNAGSSTSDNIDDDSITGAIDDAVSKVARVGLDCGVGIDLFRFNLDVRYNLLPNMYSYEDESYDAKAISTFVVSLGFRIFGNNK
ncbi:MAG: porin family protein [bacterium]